MNSQFKDTLMEKDVLIEVIADRSAKNYRKKDNDKYEELSAELGNLRHHIYTTHHDEIDYTAHYNRLNEINVMLGEI